MKHRRLIVRFILASWIGLLSASQLMADEKNSPSKPKILQPVEKGRASMKTKEVICRLLPQPCEAHAIVLYTSKSESPDIYYVINDNDLLIARLQLQVKDQWRLTDSWSFKDYEPSSPYDVGLEEDASSPRIHPALYPVSGQEWAIAIVRTYRESYSGGGGFLRPPISCLSTRKTPYPPRSSFLCRSVVERPHGLVFQRRNISAHSIVASKRMVISRSTLRIRRIRKTFFGNSFGMKRHGLLMCQKNKRKEPTLPSIC